MKSYTRIREEKVAGMGCEGGHYEQKECGDGNGWTGGLAGEGADGKGDGGLLTKMAGT